MSAIQEGYGLKVTRVGDANTHMQLSESSKASISVHKEKQRKIDLYNLARKIAVPVNDHEVKTRLRVLQEPITIFGERVADRRERLRGLLAQLSIDGKLDAFNAQFQQPKAAPQPPPRSDSAYLAESDNPDELIATRLRVLAFSLKKAAQRVAVEKQERTQLGLVIGNDNSSTYQPAVLNRAVCVSIPDAGTTTTTTPQELMVESRKLYQQDYQHTFDTIRNTHLELSQIGDHRAVSSLSISSDSKLLATGSWSGVGKVWSIDNPTSPLFSLVGHSGHIHDIKFRQSSQCGLNYRLANIATAGVDGIYLWPLHHRMIESDYGRGVDNYGTVLSSSVDIGVDMGDFDVATVHDHTAKLEDSVKQEHAVKSETLNDDEDGNHSGIQMSDEYQEYLSSKAANTQHLAKCPKVLPIQRLSCHTARVNRLYLHPAEDLLFSTSHDSTYRMFDITTGKCILTQYGHSSPTYAIAGHEDGSLLCVGDLGAHARLWDIRTGRALTVLEGHAGQILSCDFGSGTFSHLLATGAGDNTVKMWDLRMRKCIYTIPAHNKLVSDVKFKPNDSRFLLTSSYDHTCAVYSTLTFARVALYKGHKSRVMRADFTPDGDNIISAGYDCSWKVWKKD